MIRLSGGDFQISNISAIVSIATRSFISRRDIDCEDSFTSVSIGVGSTSSIHSSSALTLEPVFGAGDAEFTDRRLPGPPCLLSTIFIITVVKGSVIQERGRKDEILESKVDMHV